MFMTDSLPPAVNVLRAICGQTNKVYSQIYAHANKEEIFIYMLTQHTLDASYATRAAMFS